MTDPSQPAIEVLGCGQCIPDPQLVTKLGLAGTGRETGIDVGILPAMVRRRTSTATRVAITAASRACSGTASDAQASNPQTPAIFVSSVGEMQVTDTLCAAIAQQDYPLSPTLFHNSVHNTAAGYWSMATGNMAAMQAMGALQDGFALGLLEAWCQLRTSAGRVLLVVFDQAMPEGLVPDYRWSDCGFALLLGRAGAGTDGKHLPLLRQPVQAAPSNEPATRLEQAAAEFPLYNPALAAVPLMRALLLRAQPSPTPRHQTIALSTGPRPWSVELVLP